MINCIVEMEEVMYHNISTFYENQLQENHL